MTNEMSPSTKTAPRKRKIVSLDARKSRAGWFFILPFIIGFILIYLPMLYDSIWMSFNKVSQASANYSLTFVGFENYRTALFTYKSGNDVTFLQVLLTGLQELAFNVPAILIFSLFMAVMLNQKMAGRAVFRSIFFVPVILSTGIMESIAAADVLSTYMEQTSGIDDGSGKSTADQLVNAVDLEMLFSSMKVGTGIVSYVTSAINNIYGIVNRSGVQMLIFLSALQSISPAIYESCKIDGATAWETFWKITFPMISPMILVNGIYTIIDAFTTDSNSVMSFISGAYTSTDGNVISSAMSWIYFLIVIAIVAVIGAIFSAYVFYQRKSD